MAEPGRVVFLYGYMWQEREAVAKAIRELAAELEKSGVEVALRGIERRRVIDSSGSVAKKLHRAASEAFFSVSALRYILANRASVQTVISVDIPSGIGYVGYAARLVSRGRIANISWVMDLYRAGSESPTFRGRLEIAALRSASKIVTIGSCMSRLLHKRFNLESTVIPLWHDSLEIRPESEGTARAANAPLRILYSGSARAIHPLDGLVRAVDGMRSSVSLSLIGGGTEMVASKMTVAKLASTNVTIQTRLPDEEFFAAVSDADVHVVSLDETATGTCVPSKTYAAMAAGKPVLYLGSAEGQAAQDISDAECGFVVGSKDVAAIMGALQTYVDEPELRARHGRNASTFYSERRTVQFALPQWLENMADA